LPPEENCNRFGESTEESKGKWDVGVAMKEDTRFNFSYLAHCAISTNKLETTVARIWYEMEVSVKEQWVPEMWLNTFDTVDILFSSW
jgi:hypothetical protein